MGSIELICDFAYAVFADSRLPRFAEEVMGESSDAQRFTFADSDDAVVGLDGKATVEGNVDDRVWLGTVSWLLIADCSSETRGVGWLLRFSCRFVRGGHCGVVGCV